MQDFNIVLGGLTSCGKTCYGKRICKHFDMHRLSASEILLNLSEELGYQHYKQGEDKHHYRLREKAHLLNESRRKNSELDRIVDQKVLDLLKSTRGVVIETLTAPFMLKGSEERILKIYFDVSLKTRINRAYISSDSMNLDELESKINGKDLISRDLIRTLRGFDIFDRELIYQNNDIVIDNSGFDECNDEKIIEKEKAKNVEVLIACILTARKEMRGDEIPASDHEKAKYVINNNSTLIKKMPVLTS